MPLTFDQLESALTPVGGRIDVAAGAFGTPSVQTLFETYLADERFVLTRAQAVADPDRQEVVVTGALAAGAFLRLEDASVPRATFRLLGDGSVTARVEVRVDDDAWRLPQSFPTLADTVLDDIDYDAAAFTLDSTAPDVLPVDFRRSFGYPPDVPLVAQRLVRGLSFRAELTFTDEIARDFALLFTTPLAMSGPIEVYIDADGVFPQFLLDLASDSGRTQPVGDYDFRFGLRLACPLIEVPNAAGTSVAPVPAPVLAVETHLVPGGRAQAAAAQADGIPIVAYLYKEAGGRVVFNVGEPPEQPVKSDALPGLLNGTSVAGLLDPGEGFPVADWLTLERLSVEVGLEPLALERISVLVRMGDEEGWDVFDLVRVDGIAVLLEVTAAGGSFTPRAAAYTRATLADNPDVALSAYIVLPDLTFACELAEARPVDLTQIVKDRFGVDIPLPRITGGRFSLRGDVKARTYVIEAGLEQAWTIAGEPDNGLTLGNIGLSIATDTRKVVAAANATLTLAGATVIVSAQRSAGGEWTFLGQTAMGATIDLTALLAELAAVFGLDLPAGLPEVDLSELQLEYHRPSGDLTVQGQVGVPDASLDLTRLPLVGEHFDPGEALALEAVTITVGRQAGTTTGELAMLVRLGTTDSVEVTIPLTRAAPPPALLPARVSPRALAARRRTGAVYPAEGSGVWIPVQRSFGPVRVEKVGFTLAEGGLGVQFIASITLAGLTVRVLGLELIIPLRPPFVPGFDIAGLELGYDTPALTIAGGLLKVEQPDYLQFDGYLIVKAKAFSITALASFATSKPPSMFAFAFLDAPIGGPPFFFVTGFGGGFGINRSLELPAIEDVAKFPLVAAASKDTNPFGPDPGLPDFISGMGQSIRVAIGQNWIAAGIRFTSFKLVESYALLTVAFGTRVQIGLLGLATVRVPPAAPQAVAEVHLALRAVYDPERGAVEVSGLLTPDSYILSRQCHLTGGFAFYAWFAPSDFAGDFVVTIGGYNPYYTPPDHYPGVPRLGFNWKVEPSPLVLKGGMYLALTPHVAMAGGFLDATWERGDIKAWFAIQADFLVQWKPFHYDARMGASFGVKATVNLAVATVTISVSVGADLHVWGPPFSGKARIHLNVISFTIEFGDASPEPPPPLGWADFRDSFLSAGQSAAALGAPAPTDAVLRALVADGLLRTLADDRVVVDPQRFVLAVQTLVPAKDVTLNDAPVEGEWKDDFGVGPMALAPAAVSSELALDVTLDGRAYDRLLGTATVGKAPKALWHHEPRLDTTLNADPQLPDLAQGVSVVPVVEDPGHSLPIEIAALMYDPAATVEWWWGTDVAPTDDPFGGLDPYATLADTIAAPEPAAARAGIVAALMDTGFAVSPAIDIAPLTDRDHLGLVDPPQLRYLGEEKVAS